jgi:hypothetical protein
VRTSLDFHRGQAGALAAEQAVVTGPAVAIPGFCEELSAVTGLPVTAGVVAESREGAYGGVAANRLAIAAGLAIEQAPVRMPVESPRAPEASEAPAPEPHPEAAG